MNFHDDNTQPWDGPGVRITLTCDDCHQPYETDADDVRDPWHRCHACREQAFYARQERQRVSDETYRRAVRREFDDSSKRSA